MGFANVFSTPTDPSSLASVTTYDRHPFFSCTTQLCRQTEPFSFKAEIVPSSLPLYKSQNRFPTFAQPIFGSVSNTNSSSSSSPITQLHPPPIEFPKIPEPVAINSPPAGGGSTRTGSSPTREYGGKAIGRPRKSRKGNVHLHHTGDCGTTWIGHLRTSGRRATKHERLDAS